MGRKTIYTRIHQRLRDMGLKPHTPAYLKMYRKLRGFKSLKATNYARFGGLREYIIRRDGECCVMCGMSRKQHKKEFGRDITVNHIDKQGRYSDLTNNDSNNLETLCLRCHGHKDALKHGKYSKYLANQGWKGV